MIGDMTGPEGALAIVLLLWASYQGLHFVLLLAVKLGETINHWRQS